MEILEKLRARVQTDAARQARRDRWNEAAEKRWFTIYVHTCDAAKRARGLSLDEIRQLRNRLASGVPILELAKQLRLPYLTLYRVLRKASRDE